jgi:hypothetical protein
MGKPAYQCRNIYRIEFLNPGLPMLRPGKHGLEEALLEEALRERRRLYRKRAAACSASRVLGRTLLFLFTFPIGRGLSCRGLAHARSRKVISSSRPKTSCLRRPPGLDLDIARRIEH